LQDIVQQKCDARLRCVVCKTRKNSLQAKNNGQSWQGFSPHMIFHCSHTPLSLNRVLCRIHRVCVCVCVCDTYTQGWPEPYMYTWYMTASLVIYLPRIPVYTPYIWFVISNVAVSRTYCTDGSANPIYTVCNPKLSIHFHPKYVFAGDTLTDSPTYSHISARPHTHISAHPHTHISTSPHTHISTSPHTHISTSPHTHISTSPHTYQHVPTHTYLGISVC